MRLQACQEVKYSLGSNQFIVLRSVCTRRRFCLRMDCFSGMQSLGRRRSGWERGRGANMGDHWCRRC